ncbi:hypothetical protein P9112_008191 [Eukaryota sp. TZLM1-RC]
MSHFKSLPIPQRHTIARKVHTESLFWRCFRVSDILPVTGTPTSLDFSPVTPFDLIISSGPRVAIYDTQSRTLRKEITRFQSGVLRCRYNLSGELIVTSTDDGLVRAFTSHQGTSLRSLLGHEGPVNDCRFFEHNQQQILSCGNDKTVRLWSLETASNITSFAGHSQYVKSISSLPNRPVILSGSNDCSVRLWDSRSGKEEQRFDCENPVESVVSYPGGSLMAVANGPSVSVFDLVAGRMMMTSSRHNKPISNLSFTNKGHRLICSSLDCTVSVLDSSNLELCHTFKSNSPVIDAKSSPNLHNISFASLDGSVYLKSLKKKMSLNMDELFSKTKLKSSTNVVNMSTSTRYKSVKKFEKFLQKFQYGKAVDDVVTRGHLPHLIALLIELRRRGALVIGLDNKEPEMVIKMINIFSKIANDPGYNDLFCEVFALMVELYEPLIMQNNDVCRKFENLALVINSKITTMNKAMEVKGIIESLISCS